MYPCLDIKMNATWKWSSRFNVSLVLSDVFPVIINEAHEIIAGYLPVLSVPVIGLI